jgi:hypothetical protein
MNSILVFFFSSRFSDPHPLKAFDQLQQIGQTSHARPNAAASTRAVCTRDCKMLKHLSQTFVGGIALKHLDKPFWSFDHQRNDPSTWVCFM